jgi:hypothetical protein
LFGDEDFSPAPLSQLGRLLESHYPADTHEVELTRFRVIDLFPQRLSAATSGALFGALGSLGYAVFFTGSDASTTADNITCVAQGRADNRSFQHKASVPYRISPFAGLVKNDPAFKDAVNTCLDRLAKTITETPASSN